MAVEPSPGGSPAPALPRPAARPAPRLRPCLAVEREPDGRQREPDGHDVGEVPGGAERRRVPERRPRADEERQQVADGGAHREPAEEPERDRHVERADHDRRGGSGRSARPNRATNGRSTTAGSGGNGIIPRPVGSPRSSTTGDHVVEVVVARAVGRLDDGEPDGELAVEPGLGLPGEVVVDGLVGGPRELVEREAGQHEAEADDQRGPGPRGGRRGKGAAGIGRRALGYTPVHLSARSRRPYQHPCQAPLRARARGPASRPGFACGTRSSRSRSFLRSASPFDSSSHTSCCPAPGSRSTSAASQAGRWSSPRTGRGASTTARSSSTTRRATSTSCGRSVSSRRRSPSRSATCSSCPRSSPTSPSRWRSSPSPPSSGRAAGAPSPRPASSCSCP